MTLSAGRQTGSCVTGGSPEQSGIKADSRRFNERASTAVWLLHLLIKYDRLEFLKWIEGDIRRIQPKEPSEHGVQKAL